MMRDVLKSGDYFITKYNSEKARIKKFECTMKELDSSNKKGINIGKIHLANLYLNCVKLSYSIGAPMKDMYNYYLVFLQYYKVKTNL